MDTELSSNFKSIFAKFEVNNCSKKPAISPPPPNISNVRSNPALLGVINSLENKPKPIPPPAKPNPALLSRPTSANKPPLPSKEKLFSVQNNMRLNRGLRHTLYITDSPRSDGDGVCSQSPQVYRQSWSASLDSNLHPVQDTNQSDSQDFYEIIDDSKTVEKPQIPLKSHVKYQTSNLIRQKPSQAPQTNQPDTQDCYEVVDDPMKSQGKPSPQFLADLKSRVLAFSEQKLSPVMESSQYETQDCYEVVHDPPKTPVKPSSPFTTQSSFLEKKPSPVLESSQYEAQDCYEVVHDPPEIPVKPPSPFTTQSSFSELKTFAGPEMRQECYEEVDSTFHLPVERLPPIGGNPKHKAPFPDPPPISEINELDRQDNYEAVNSIFHLQLEPPSPFNDQPKSQSNSSSMKTNPKPVRNFSPSWKTTSSDHSPNKEDEPPSPPDAKIKPKQNISVNKTPRKKLLPSSKLLGLPPPKEPRPPHVDLTSYCSSALPCNVMQRPPKEAAETELPAPSLSSQEEECYDDTIALRTLQEGESTVYEVEDMLPEMPKIKESKPYVRSPSPEGGCECYDDILKLRESTANCDVYEVEESGSLLPPEPARQHLWEVTEENKDFRIGNLNADRSTLPRSDSKDGKISKSEQAFRKKFKISGLEDTLYTTTIVLDFKPEKYMLPVKKGDMVDVIRITDCPPGKWLAKDNQESYGFVPVSCVDISKDILSFSNQHLMTGPVTSDIYADVERTYDSGMGTDLSIASDSYSVKSDDTYDDVDNKSSTLNNAAGKAKGFGNLFRKDKSKKEELWSPSISVNSNGTSEGDGDCSSVGGSDGSAREKEDKSSSWRSFFHKARELKGRAESPKNEGKGNTQVSLKNTKEEKTFREKFKYTGEITVFSVATINDSAPLSPKDKMDLPVKPGETVDVIDVTNEDQIICRNSEGKFGYVAIAYLNFQPNY